MKPLIKICGLKTAEAAQAVSDAGVDMAGFMFFEKSPRYLATFEQAKEVDAHLAPEIARVAVTVNADDKYLAQIVDHLEPDYLQLHGGETPQRVTEIKRKFGLPVIKVCLISDKDDVDGVVAFEGVADLFLLDAKPKADQGSRPGGWGDSFDWQLLAKGKGGRDFKLPWLLAGGLNASNVNEAIRLVEPGGVDLSSGVETSPGVKSPELIKEFVAAVRNG